MYIADGQQVSLFVVLVEGGKKLWIVDFASVAVKYLALAVDDIFLQIVGHTLARTHVLHRVGYIETRFFGQAEIIVDGSFRCKNHTCKIGNIDFLLSVFFCRQTLDLDERAKYQLKAELLGNVEIWRLPRLGSGL